MSNRIAVEISVVITARTALSIGAGGSTGTIADKTIVRDGWGRPLIPGSQLKGRTRHAAEAILAALNIPGQRYFDDDISQMNPIRAIFGSPQHRSSLNFIDLIGFSGEIEQLGKPNDLPWLRVGPIRPSVALSRRRGGAEDARLFFQETAPEGLQYSTYPHAAISGTLPDKPHIALLWAALQTTPRWGGANSRGLGWACVKVTVKADDKELEAKELQQALRDLKLQTEAC